MSSDPLIRGLEAQAAMERAQETFYSEIRAAVAAGKREEVKQALGHDMVTLRAALRNNQEEETAERPPARLVPARDPILVRDMRAFPTGDVRHVPAPGSGIAMSGTATQTFLAAYDEAVDAAYQRGYEDGYQVASEEAAMEARVQAELDDYSRQADDDD